MFSPARGKVGKLKALQSPKTPTPHVSERQQKTPVSLLTSSSPLLRWSSSSRLPPRISSPPENEERARGDGEEPVFVCSFPAQLRNSFLERHPQRTDGTVQGGMDRQTGLSWIIHNATLYVWSHLNSRAALRCAVMTVPSQLPKSDGRSGEVKLSDDWLVAVVGWCTEDQNDVSFGKACSSAGVVMCHRKTLAAVYWPDVFKDGDAAVVLGPVENVEGSSAASWGETRPTVRGSPLIGNSEGPAGSLISSLIVSSVPGESVQSCVVIACRSNAELWRYDCSPLVITRQQIVRDSGIRHDAGLMASNCLRAQSIVWRCSSDSPDKPARQLLLLTGAELECWNVELVPGGNVTTAWRFNILEDSDTRKDLAGHKQVWLLDLQVDDGGHIFTVLVASLLKDRFNKSSSMQYSLLSFWDKEPPEGVVVTKEPLQVILPNARVEDEDVLYSMRLRVGGKPSGSALVLAGDGTASVAHYRPGSLRLYHFDLGWGAGKVLDASVVPAFEDVVGAWLVLTEKSGVWGIPEKAVVLGAVEPREGILSMKGSSVDDSAMPEKQPAFHTTPSRVRSETSTPERRPTAAVAHRPILDEEAEAIVGRMFQLYLTTGRANSAREKLERSGAFEREGELNIFARTSRVIVDTLAKHWVSGGGGRSAIMAAISSQLVEKQRRHQQYLNFLSVSGCHEELQTKQRAAMLAILEHGEKLGAMIQLRELHNAKAQARVPTLGSFSVSEPQEEAFEASGALWDTVQLVGEKARRNNVMLMDREKSEIFYTRVSDLEEFFSCVQLHASSILEQELGVKVQIERLCDVAEATTSAVKAALRYRDSQGSWYPPPEGLTPWICRTTVRAGLWKIASLILEIIADARVSVPSLVSKLASWLEVVADVLLDAYAGAITSKLEREEEYRGLQMEYWSRRDSLLGVLQQQIQDEVDTSVQQSLETGGREQQRRRSLLLKMYQPLIGLARRHAGYETLYNICSDVKDMDQLRDLMHESMGLREGRFSHYVFDQLCKSKMYSKLLQFGEEFQEELDSFLQEHTHLRWLHELFLQQYTSACATLHSVAFASGADGERSGLVDILGGPKVERKLRERRRLLYLAKLSALAGGDMGGGEKISKIDATISIIEVQEETHQKGFVTDSEIVPPSQLVELCLKSGDRDLVMRAFDVLAFAGTNFRKSNHSVLEAAWLRAADEDNWSAIRDLSEETGWSDEQCWLALQSTVLFRMSKRCYGEDSAVYGAPFHDVLPLFDSDVILDENSLIGNSGIAAKSVESVLSQHQNFSDAGEAMLAALRLGATVDSDADGKELELEPMIEY